MYEVRGKYVLGRLLSWTKVTLRLSCDYWFNVYWWSLFDRLEQFSLKHRKIRANSFWTNCTLLSRNSGQVKLSVLSLMCLRYYRLSDPVFTDKETAYIYDKFTKLPFPRRLIDEAHKKAQQRFFRPPVQQDPSEYRSTVRLSLNSFTMDCVVHTQSAQNTDH